MTTISHDELLARTCFMDKEGNVFSYLTVEDLPAHIAANTAPPSFEMVFAGSGINPKYAHVLAASFMLYSMAEQSKVIFEGHSEQLQQVGTPGTMDLGVAFEGMAATLNLAQRSAIEGMSAMVANSEKYRK